MNEDRPAQNVEVCHYVVGSPDNNVQQLQERQESQATEPPPTQLRIDTKVCMSVE